jgi:hypothetical protein
LRHYGKVVVCVHENFLCHVFENNPEFVVETESGKKAAHKVRALRKE